MARVRDNRGTQRWRCILKLTPLRLLISIWSSVEAQCSQEATRATVISSRPRAMQDVMIPLRALKGVTETVQWEPLGRSPILVQNAQGSLRNLIGDPDAFLEL